MIVVEQKKQKADYEREEYQNDVRYQNRTEITLDYVVAKRSQGLFRFCLTYAAECRLFFARIYPTDPDTGEPEYARFLQKMELVCKQAPTFSLYHKKNAL